MQTCGPRGEHEILSVTTLPHAFNVDAFVLPARHIPEKATASASDFTKSSKPPITFFTPVVEK